MTLERTRIDSPKRADDPMALSRANPKTDGRVVVDADSTVSLLGDRIRGLRAERKLTLQTLAERTGLSLSMLSLVERGKTSPSIGTLVAISSALGVQMTDLFDDGSTESKEPVVRAKDQPVYITAHGLKRRIVRTDDARGLELAYDEYEPGVGSGGEPVHHSGHEYGIVLQGVLTVEVDGGNYQVRPGDCISYHSQRSHRIANESAKRVRALWINLKG